MKSLEINPKTSIIILNYNGGKLIETCIKSVFNNSMNFELILIDNNSSDNSQIICKKKFPKIILYENEQNIGLTARNIGIDKAKGEFIVFLDSDTVVEQNWLENLLESFKKNGEGLYQPKILEMNQDQVISSAGNMINIFGLPFSTGRGKKDNGQYDKFRKIGYTSGACTFTSIKIIKKIGVIDPIFFAYHDDLDYGWRGSLLNISSYYEPKSIIYHHVSHTLSWNSKKFFLLERNRWICLLTLYSTKTLIKLFPLLCILEIGIFGYFISKRMSGVKIKAFFDLIRLNNKIKKRKRSLQKLRKIDDHEIIENFVDDFFLTTSRELKQHSKISKIITLLSKFSKKLII